MSYIKNKREAVVSLRLSDPEKKHIENLAAQDGINIGTYIRKRLFEDDYSGNSDNANDSIRELERLQIISSKLIMSVAQSVLDQENFKECQREIADRLREGGYE